MITIDNREKIKYLKEQGDAKETLEYLVTDEDGNKTGEVYSFDVLIETLTGKKQIRGERKSFDDFVQTWYKAELIGQLVPVDFLVVEMDPFDLADARMEDQHGNPRSEREMEEHDRMVANVKKHIWHLNHGGLPVHTTTNVYETMDLYRYLEAKGHDMEVRENQVRNEGDCTQDRVLGALPCINPRARLKDSSRTKGEAISDLVDWGGVAKALNLQKWHSIPGARIGPGTTLGIAEQLIKRRVFKYGSKPRYRENSVIGEIVNRE